MEKGDSFYSIAKKSNTSIKAIQEANPGVSSTKLKVGQKLQVPAGGSASSASAPAEAYGSPSSTDNGTTYVVKAGDMLERIARRHGTYRKSHHAEKQLEDHDDQAGPKVKDSVERQILRRTGRRLGLCDAIADSVINRDAGLPQPGVLLRFHIHPNSPTITFSTRKPIKLSMKLATTTLLFCVATLLLLGMVVLYSSSTAQVGADYLVKQLIWCAVGLVGAVVAASVDYRHYKKISILLMILAAGMLLLVFVPHIGIKVKGASRWIGYRGIRFQPSELAKIAIIIFLAHYGERYQRQMGTFWRGLVVPGIFVGGILALIFVEPDRGCTILMAMVSVTMLVVGGARMKFLIPPAIAAVTALAFSLWHDPMRMKRIIAWLHPEENKEGVGWQAYQAMIALGSGGWTGLGLGNGRQKLGFIPEHHTDFIFSIIGEELGLITTIAVVIIFVLFVICGIVISSRPRTPLDCCWERGRLFSSASRRLSISVWSRAHCPTKACLSRSSAMADPICSSC